MTESERWVETRHGGFRRKPNAGSSVVEHLPDLEKVRKSRDTVEAGVANPADTTTRTGFDSLPAYRWLKRSFILKLNERLGLPECPYVVRWRLETPWFSMRLHHWLAPDDDRAKHDHPWDFVTFVLRGGYTDSSPCLECHGTGGRSWLNGDVLTKCPRCVDGSVLEHLRAPAIRYRPATHQHTVFPDESGAWTVIVTGPKVRNWGFWVNGKFVKMNKYFLKYGHHPCE